MVCFTVLAGSATKTQEDSKSDEVTISLFNTGSQRWKMSYNTTAQSSSPLETDKQNQSVGLKPWEVLKLADRNDDRQKIPISSDLSSDKSYENLTENMDLDSLNFWRNNSFHQTSDQQTHRNSKQTMDIEFVRPGEYVQKERKISSKFQAIEHMLNITPQLRLQMLMCREYKKYTNILLVAMFGRDMLATHSLNGTGTSKPKLDGQKVNHVIGNMINLVVIVYIYESVSTIFHCKTKHCIVKNMSVICARIYENDPSWEM